MPFLFLFKNKGVHCLRFAMTASRRLLLLLFRLMIVVSCGFNGVTYTRTYVCLRSLSFKPTLTLLRSRELDGAVGANAVGPDLADS